MSETRSPKLAELRITRGAWSALNDRVIALERTVLNQATTIENIESYLEQLNKLAL